MEDFTFKNLTVGLEWVWSRCLRQSYELMGGKFTRVGCELGIPNEQPPQPQKTGDTIQQGKGMVS